MYASLRSAMSVKAAGIEADTSRELGSGMG